MLLLSTNTYGESLRTASTSTPPTRRLVGGLVHRTSTGEVSRSHTDWFVQPAQSVAENPLVTLSDLRNCSLV